MNDKTLCLEIGNFYGKVTETENIISVDTGERVHRYFSYSDMLTDWVDTLIEAHHDGGGIWEKEIIYIYAHIIKKWPVGIRRLKNKTGVVWKAAADIYTVDNPHGKSLYLGTYPSIVDAIYARRKFLADIKGVNTKTPEGLQFAFKKAEEFKELAKTDRNKRFEDTYEIELSLNDGFVNVSIKGSDLAALKGGANAAILETLKERECPCGYYDVEITITKNGEYFDSEPEALIYVDKDFENVLLAHVIGLDIAGKTNMPNLAIDYIAIELADGTVTTLDWDTSYWDGDNEEGSFFIELPSVSTGNDKVFLDAEILKTAKIKSIQVYSPVKVENPYVSIEKIDINEDEVLVETIECPEIQEVVFES